MRARQSQAQGQEVKVPSFEVLQTHRLVCRSWFIAPLASLALLALTSSAQATTVIHEFIPGSSAAISAGVPAGQPVHGLLSGVEAIALGSGHLFVAEGIGGSSPPLSRVDRFSASSGVFEAQLAHSEGKPGELETGKGVAVAGVSHDVFAGAHEKAAGNPGVVGVFSETGALLSTWTGKDTPHGSFGPRGVQDVAVDNNVVDPAAGDLYVASYYEEGGVHEPVVDVFKPEAGGGEPVSPANVKQLTGTCGHIGEVAAGAGVCAVIPFSRPNRVAVDESDGVLLVADGTVVDVFAPGTVFGEYLFEGQITGTSPTEPFTSQIVSLAVDGEGDVYVLPSNSVLQEFKLLGASGEASEFVGHIAGTPADASPAGPFEQATSVAVDPQAPHDVFAGDVRSQRGVVDVFGPDLPVPSVKTKEPTGVGVRGATLTGTVNPEELGAATCRFVWGTSEAFGNVAPCEPSGPFTGKLPVAVQAKLEGLEPDTTYYYRLQATSKATGYVNPGEESEDQHFTTLGPAILASVTEVASTSVTFDGSVDPRGGETSAFFQYGRCGATLSTCSASGYETSVPAAPGEALGGGPDPVELAPRHVQGLLPGTAYHYRVVASSVIEGKTEEFDGGEASFTTQGSGAFVLPDGRQYEMVSPPQKRGALIETRRVPGMIQAAANGEAFTYFTDEPTEAEAAGYSRGVQVLSTRGGAGSSSWQSRDIATPHQQITGAGANFGEEYRFFSEDLSIGIVHPIGAFTTTISPEASEQTTYLRSDFENGDPEDVCTSTAGHSCYQPLVTGCPAPPGVCPQSVREHANVPPGTSFGETGACPGPAGNRKLFCGPEFVGASPDAKHFILSSRAALSRTPIEVNGLYEWSQGSLALVSVLPANEAKQPGEAARNASLGYAYVAARHAVSDDGSRVIWEAEQISGQAHLYMRDMATGQTVRLDAVQGGSGSGGLHPRFQTAAGDGSKVYFTDTQRLTEHAGAEVGSEGEKYDLYECEMVEEAGQLACRLSDLTPLVGEQPAFVQGAVVGSSVDGSWVYFVADGVLENNGVPVPGAVHGSCNQTVTATSPGTQCNLYARHDGITRLVAVISGADFPDWADDAGEQLGRLTARVSPNGRWLAFMSQRELTGYDNHDALSGQPDEEAYLYNGESEHLVCVSCQPTGARPTGQEYSPGGENMPLVGEFNKWEGTSWLAADLPAWTIYGFGIDARYQSRYLSNSGRMFFNSRDALVPQDSNGAWDVYEYDPEGVPAESAHSCSSASTSGSEVFRPARAYQVEGHSGVEPAGCVGLISSGTSSGESAFMDASETGGDVFFVTTSQLVPQDVDNAYDVYDAHECTSESPCFPTPAAQPPECTTADACRAAPQPQPSLYGPPPSATFNGVGNLTPEAGKPAAKKQTAAQLRAAKLKQALKQCRKDKKKGRRKSCEKAAHAKYGAKTAKKPKGKK